MSTLATHDRSQSRSDLVRAAVQHAVQESTSPVQLLQSLCDICVHVAGYRMAWFGIAEQDALKTVRPVAVAGVNERYVEDLEFRWDESPWGLGPTGTAIRTGNPCINWDWTRVTDHRLDPWRTEALLRGYASSIALPLFLDGEVYGALTLYSAQKEQLGDGELLASVISELTDGLKRLIMRRAHDASADPIKE